MKNHWLRLSKNSRSFTLNHRSILISLTLLFVGSAFWFVQAINFENFIANVGSSPLHWLYLSENDVLKSIDWPTGTKNLGRSLPINIYWILDKYFYIDASITIYIYTYLEIIISLFAYSFFFNKSIKNDSIFLNIFFSLIVALCSFQALNLARFNHPSHYGLYYSFAGAARIVALAYILNGERWKGSIALAISVMTHPLIGGIGVLAASFIIVFRGISSIKSYFLPAIISGAAALIWIWISYSGTTVTSGEIPREYWFSLTQIFNYHWYPQEIGLFEIGRESYVRLLSFVSLVILFLIFECSQNQYSISIYRSEILLIVSILIVLTIIGLIISVTKLSPFLVKLSIHRSGDLLAILCFASILPRLIGAIENPYQNFISVAALFILISLFAYGRILGFPLLLSLLITFPIFLSALRSQLSINNLVIISLWVIGLLFLAYYSVLPMITSYGVHLGILKKTYLSFPYISINLFAGLVFVLFSSGVLTKRGFRIVILLLVIFAILTNHSFRFFQYNSPRIDSFKQIQTWARMNTPDISLFMLDPGNNDAWRDLSRRSSYGTVNEWLHKGWLYDSNASLFREGVRRFSTLGLNFKNYLDSSRLEVRADASEKYNNMNVEMLTKIKGKEGVDFFVFEKEKNQNLYPRTWIKFENRHFFVISPN